jgi:hypothetical protein
MKPGRLVVAGEGRIVFLFAGQEIAVELGGERRIVAPDEGDLLGRLRVAPAEKARHGAKKDGEVLARLEIERIECDRLLQFGFDFAQAHHAAHDSILRGLEPERAPEPLVEFRIALFRGHAFFQERNRGAELLAAHQFLRLAEKCGCVFGVQW